MCRTKTHLQQVQRYYSSDSDNDPVFEEIVDIKTLKPINSYIVAPQPLPLASTTTKVLKK